MRTQQRAKNQCQFCWYLLCGVGRGGGFRVFVSGWFCWGVLLDAHYARTLVGAADFPRWRTAARPGVLPRLRGGIHGEFDPGSGRMLAACLTHASRTVIRFRPGISGERVSNTWAICPRFWDNPGKPGLIPDMTRGRMVCAWKAPAIWDGPAAYQLVGGVMAYQGDDG